MAENSRIQWTHHTFNPWRGCTKIATGCTNCYADAMSVRNPKTLGVWGPNGTRVMAAPAAWREPLKWDRAAAAAGERHRVFCASLADVFEDWEKPVLNHFGQYGIKQGAPEHWAWNDYPVATLGYPLNTVTLDDVRRKLFELIDATPSLNWLLLTKRPESISKMWPPVRCDYCAETKCSVHRADAALGGRLGYFRSNVWLGTSISDQATADTNIPKLLKCRDLAPVLFVSAEPLLGEVNLRRWLCPRCGGDGTYLGAFGESIEVCKHDVDTRTLGYCASGQIDWLIVGGESGPHARPCAIDHVRELVNECATSGTACFVKQLGARPVTYKGDQLFLSDKKGGDWSEWPTDFRVRQFPTLSEEST